ncbi:WxL domain-containing protein [uncultured Vagococcus sp.]|uniref:WxL domain-containing protein n=1 Tax=uncultured Vagococcus sp. TaxID=189676 RepID=UPI0028D2DBE2|nr:WxL domain-containing protein [uncultured Vagococcus sp.]
MKKLTLVTLGVATFGTLVLGAQQAFADAVQPVANGEATVLFAADNDIELPPVVIPPVGEGDGGAINPDGSDGTPGDGDKSFNIAWVSHFRFNERNTEGAFKPIKLNANGMTLWAKGTKLTLDEVDKEGKLVEPVKSTVYNNIPNFVQVADNRGALTGWNLSVQASPFVGKDGAENLELGGTKLSLNQPSIKGPAGIDLSSPLAPTTAVSTGFEINGSPKNVMTANANAGVGSWSLKFGEETKLQGAAYETLVEDTGVKLDIPASAKAKAGVEYKSTVKWILSDAPYTAE